MAKVYSHSESRAKGSVGMTTYRYVRGKVVQSQKVAPWDPSIDQVGNATRWNERTALLGIISLWCSVHSESIKHSFNRSKGGSQRNYFMKKNYNALKAAFSSLAQEYAFTRVAPSIQAIEDAMGSYAAAHANTIYRIKKSGYDIAFLSGNWDDADDPIAAVEVSDIVATLDGSYNLTAVEIVGSNLAGEIKIKLGGADVPGSIVIAADKASATFTPGTAPLVKGTKSLAVMLGSRVLYTENIEGDPRTYYTLALSVDPANGGSVSGAGEYPAGTVVPISATPAQGKRFVKWSDEDTNASRSITLTQNMSLVAQFESPSLRITLSLDGIQSCTVNGVSKENGDVIVAPVGENLAIVATPFSGYGFQYWSISPTTGEASFSADSMVNNVANESATLYIKQYSASAFTLTASAQE